MPGRDVERDLRLRVGEAELRVFCDVELRDQPVDVALADACQPGATPCSPEWAFEHRRRPRPREGPAQAHGVARPLAQRALHPRARAVAVGLWRGARGEPDLRQHVGVHHGDRARVVHGPWAVDEPGRGHAVHRQTHLAEVTAAHRELRPEVIAGCHPRHGLDGAERIVSEHAAQFLELRRAHTEFDRRGRARRLIPGPNDERFGIGASAWRERHREVYGATGRHLDVATGQCVADERHHQRARAGGHAVESEAALRICRRPTVGVLGDDEHTGQRGAGLCIDHAALDGAGTGWWRCRLRVGEGRHRHGQQHEPRQPCTLPGGGVPRRGGRPPGDGPRGHRRHVARIAR